MSVSQHLVEEACLRLRRGESPVAVVRYLAANGGEMLDASRVLTQCGLSLTQAKQAIDESHVWPNRAAEEAAFFDRLAGWDPAEDEN